MGKPETISSSHVAKDYKSDVKPIWCPGCGHFGVQAALFRALAHLDLPPEQENQDERYKRQVKQISGKLTCLPYWAR